MSNPFCDKCNVDMVAGPSANTFGCPSCDRKCAIVTANDEYNCINSLLCASEKSEIELENDRKIFTRFFRSSMLIHGPEYAYWYGSWEDRPWLF